MNRIDGEGRTAAVIGGSIGGLLAARVLSDHYERVLILERDDLSNEGQYRRGVPQGRHAHALLAGGQRVLESLFPGIGADLVAHGAIPADPAKDGTWFFEGSPFRKTGSGATGVLTSRPFLESALRSRIRAVPSIRIQSGVTARGLLWSRDKSRVSGIQTDDSDIQADIVVDATGRGSHAASWLTPAGYPAPREEKIDVQLTYTTRLFKPRRNVLPTDDKFVVLAPTPEGKRGGVLGLQEGNSWIVTLFGHFGNEAPADLEGYMEYARTLPSRIIYNAISEAEPISEAVKFRFPASTRRRYEEVRRLPDGFLAFGDAICSFNPIYGQGMSVAALQAQALREQMEAGEEQLARHFYKAAAKVIDTPWSIAAGNDLRMPEVKGKRSLAGRLMNWYISRLHKLAHHDDEASRVFLRVAQLLDEPSRLMTPRLAFRVLTSRYGQPSGVAFPKLAGSA